MEQWEALVSGYPASPELRPFGNAIQTASQVLKEDLAVFEKEWILHTLLLEPVELLNTIQSKRSDDTWLKVIGDSFKLLAYIVEHHSESLGEHYENIVKICQLPYEPQTQKQAIDCLIHVVKRSPIDASVAARHVNALDRVPTCKASVALLVGAICEQHPEMVSNEGKRIWRIYINLLESNKNTDKIVTSVLYGILGLFKHFGTDLPTSELSSFYDKLSKVYLKMGKCAKVCYKILEEHSNLFKVGLAADVCLREYLWDTLSDWKVAAALRSVYAAFANVVTKERLEDIINSEIVSRTKHFHTITKYTSLRILKYAQTNNKVCLGVTYDIDVQTLEFELRNEYVSYDVAEAVSFSIEANLPNCDKLLQTSMMFYKNLPTSKKKYVVVYGIFNAPPELRTTAIKFLITESCQPNFMDEYLPIWIDLFNTDNGKDLTVVEKCQFVFNDFMEHLVLELETFLEENEEEKNIPQKLSSLLTLSSHVLTLQCSEEYTRDYCILMLPLLISCIHECGVSSALMAAARDVVSHMCDDDDFGDLYKLIEIDRCRDEALLCESCLTLIHAPGGLGDPSDIIKALQIIFSRNDVEPKTLSIALVKLETLILRDAEPLNLFLDELLNMIENLKSRTDLVGKDGRVLRKDITMFLGKHSKRHELNNNNIRKDENDSIVKLNESLVLNIRNPNEGITQKLNLQKILHLAILEEEPNALQTLLVIICANLSTGSNLQEATLQVALTHVITALCSSLVRDSQSQTDADAVSRAMGMCGSVQCVQQVLHFITESKSPGVRRMLSDALEGLLLKASGSDITEQLVNTVKEHAVMMMSSDISSTKRAGLDITDSLLITMKDNNSLIKNVLPKILILISRTFDITTENTFEIASKLFIEKIHLFDEDIIEKALHDLLYIPKEGLNVRMFKKTVKMNLIFIKNVMDYKAMDHIAFFDGYFKNFNEKYVIFDIYLFANVKLVFGLKEDVCEVLLSYNNCNMVNDFFEIKPKHDFDLEAILKFLQEYCSILLVIKYEKTLQHLSDIISNLRPSSVKYIHKTLSACLSTYKKNMKRYPQILITSMENFCESLQLDKISLNIEKDSFLTNHADIVNSLKLMLDTFDTDLSVLTAKISCQKWAIIILKLYARDVNLRSKMSYFTDILCVSIKFLTLNDVKQLILEGSKVKGASNEMIGVRFCRDFIMVFYEYILDVAFWTDEMTHCCLLLNDIVQYSIRRRNREEECEKVLDLVEKLWPTYEIHTTFDKKYSLLKDLLCLPKQLSAGSKPLQWAVSALTSVTASRDDKSKLIGVLPGGEEFGETYRHFASNLPTRFSELNIDTNASLRTLLDALSTNKDHTLLDIIITLSRGDEAKGWWDDAIDSCMATLAQKSDLDLYNFVYTQCWEDLTLGVCNRVLAPLLRYSTPRICVSFFSTHLNDLLSKLRKVQGKSNAPNHYKYHKYVVDYTRALILLQIAFEKIPAADLESPKSLLYNHYTMEVEQPWYIVREACKLCTTLRDKVSCIEGGGKYYRLFHCAAFNCQSAATCRRMPEAKFYLKLFDVKVLNSLVDPHFVYKLPLRLRWSIRTRRHATSISASSAAQRGAGATRSSTVPTRTRLFLRTLSDNPLRYDLFDEDDEGADMMETQELQLNDNELNSHECMATLTCLLPHVSELQDADASWTNNVVTILKDGGNVARLLAQAICNCKEELKPHASHLRPALLAFIKKTVTASNTVKILDGLHIDTLDTLIHWREDTIELNEDAHAHLNSAIEYLINTCVENKQKESLCNSLVDDLKRVLEVYGCFVHVEWKCIESSIAGTKQGIQILKHIIKNNIYIPHLLPRLLAKFNDKDLSPTVIAELFGKSLAVCDDASVRKESLDNYRKKLENVRSRNISEYIKVMYYAQIGYSWCCDDKHLRTIINLVLKLDKERSKCLKIISLYLSNMKSTNDVVTEMFETIDLCELITTGETEAITVVMNGLNVMSKDMRRRCVLVVAKYCAHALVNVRRAALQVMLKAFDALFDVDSQPPSKRQKTETTTALLETIGSNDPYINEIMSCLGRGVADKDEQTASIIKTGVAAHLSTDSSVRFTECFYMTIYQPIINTNNSAHSVSLYALLEMYFSDLRAQDRFKKIKLKDEPLAIADDGGPSRTLTKNYHGTFRSTMGTTKNTNRDKKHISIDVQVPIDYILGNFLQFAKINPQASQVLIIELMKILTPEDNFNFKAVMSRLLAELVKKDPSELTPVILQACKIFIDDVSRIEGFQTSVVKLKDSTLGTEGEQITKVLLEDVLLRCRDPDQFVLGFSEDNFDDPMEESHTFSVEDLAATFGKLSNWDELTIQQKCRVERTCLPALWTDNDTFTKQLETYTGAGWFQKMALAYRGERKQDNMMWLREIDRWPRRQFVISAVTEAIQWQYTSDHKDVVPYDIRPSDCLAEWAARLMLRASRLTQTDEEPSQEDIMLSHSHELLWCVSASERGLSTFVLDCVKRNTLNLFEDETLPWLHQKVLALRAIGLQQNDNDVLRKALDTAEKFTPQFLEHSSPEDINAMNKLVLQLHYDLKSLSEDKLQSVLQEIMQIDRQERISQKNKSVLKSIYEFGIIYYDDLWANNLDNKSKEDVINKMADLLGVVIDYGTTGDLFASIILNKLDDLGQMDESVARNVLSKLNRLSLDDFSIDQIKNNTHLFPAHLLKKYVLVLKSEEEENNEKYKRCMQLVGDASFTFNSYCELLRRACKQCDPTEWKNVFDRMNAKIFENPYAGVDYQDLNKYKRDLNEIYEYDKTDSSKKQEILNSIQRRLSRNKLSTLRLTALCPTLTTCKEGDSCLARLLDVPPSLSIVKFDEQVTVFTDSIRRPCLIKVILSNGTSRRYLHKGGEPLKKDASALRAARAAAQLWDCGHFVDYKVTLLSDDCGLIEYLENNERLRSFIPNKFIIDDPIPRVSDEELVQSRPASLQAYRQNCARVPAHALRSEIERRSSSIEDFIAKKRRFLDSISTVTILTWIFGLGDRHLENLLCNTQDGAVCCVDWGAILEYGVRELPPARLTRNILAVCDVQVLESCLQKLLTTLRASYKLYLQIVNISFKWMGNEYNEKITYIENILKGNSLSFEITKETIEKSNLKHKDKYIELLDEVFKFEKKDNHSIQEQISCLLKHCTEPQILSVTKCGWEPWL